VFRTSAASWPVAFVLDDSLSMMPGRNLSAASSVVVEARLSRSGSANPQAGDLRGSTPAMDPRKAGALRVLINEEIG
jgi:cytochrome c-type biogenesis protein CcmH